MRLLMFCLLGIIISFISANAEESKTKQYVIDYSLYSDDTSLESKKCGKVSFSSLQDVQNDKTALILNITSSYKENKRVGASYGENRFTMVCATKGSDYEGFTKFNAEKNRWELPNYNTNNASNPFAPKIYQLKNKNSSGWLSSAIMTEEPYKIKKGLYPYFKVVSYCIFNKDKTKNICGSGIAQYIWDKKHLGTTAHDYTPVLIKILETVKFEGDK